MKLLLDTHVFIWSVNEPERLSENARRACENAENSVYLSVVSIAEIQIKMQIGKLAFSMDLPEIIAFQRRENGFQILPLEAEHLQDVRTSIASSRSV